jgi:hypothetical protein
MKFLRRLSVPASESHMALALGLSMVMLGGLLCALIWQSNIILAQRDLIRWLWDLRTTR